MQSGWNSLTVPSASHISLSLSHDLFSILFLLSLSLHFSQTENEKLLYVLFLATALAGRVGALPFHRLSCTAEASLIAGRASLALSVQCVYIAPVKILKSKSSALKVFQVRNKTFLKTEPIFDGSLCQFISLIPAP